LLAHHIQANIVPRNITLCNNIPANQSAKNIKLNQPSSQIAAKNNTKKRILSEISATG
jgi:hypothetical protein